MKEKAFENKNVKRRMAGGLAESSDRYFKFSRLLRVVREEAHLEVRADIALAPQRVLRLEVTGFLRRQ